MGGEGVNSTNFNVQQGVRKGGILFVYLFTMDELSLELTNKGKGARIGQTVINHLVFADDICLMTITTGTMKILLEICKKYAANHNLAFNPNKTELQCFLPKYMHQIKEDVSINFCGATLKHNDSVKYLGYSISCKVKYRSVILNDQIEIQKRKCEIYMKANNI